VDRNHRWRPVHIRRAGGGVEDTDRVTKKYGESNATETTLQRPGLSVVNATELPRRDRPGEFPRRRGVMAIHLYDSPAPESARHPSRRLKPVRPVLVLLLAATMSVGTAASHPSTTPAFGSTVHLADGGSSTNGGVCWGCH
jgi:hypothetical protein